MLSRRRETSTELFSKEKMKWCKSASWRREENVGIFVTLGSRDVVVVDIENKSNTRERFILQASLYLFFQVEMQYNDPVFQNRASRGQVKSTEEITELNAEV